jgi:hypothetical protein
MDSESPFPISLEPREVSCPPMYYKFIRQLLPSCKHLYVVSSVGLFKEKNKKGEHEFVVAIISPLGQHQPLTFVVVERVPNAASVSDVHRTLCSHNHYVEARDTTFSLDQPNFDVFIRTRSPQLLQYVSFNIASAGGHFLALDFCRIVAAISEYKKSYTLTRTSCYWFAGMVIRMIQKCGFPVAHMCGSTDAAGRYLGKKFFICDSKEIHDIMGLYNSKKRDDVIFFNSITG